MKTPTRFAERVYDMVQQVPYGKVTTYSTIATLIASPRAARAVGQALRAGNWAADDVPWHRVINSRGRISAKGDLHRPTLQRRLLEAEGIAFFSDKVDLKQWGWWGE